MAASVIGDVKIDARLDPAPAEGDPRLAESLVANLVGNALRHNVPGGWASIETSTVGGRAVLRVSNSGPVIPPAEVDRLFQPFQRLGDERVGVRRAGDGGLGLGLAIVRAIAVAHGAELTVHARPEGGLDITVIFPPVLDVKVKRMLRLVAGAAGHGMITACSTRKLPNRSSLPLSS